MSPVDLAVILAVCLVLNDFGRRRAFSTVNRKREMAFIIWRSLLLIVVVSHERSEAIHALANKACGNWGFEGCECLNTFQYLEDLLDNCHRHSIAPTPSIQIPTLFPTESTGSHLAAPSDTPTGPTTTLAPVPTMSSINRGTLEVVPLRETSRLLCSLQLAQGV